MLSIGSSAQHARGSEAARRRRYLVRAQLPKAHGDSSIPVTFMVFDWERDPYRPGEGAWVQTKNRATARFAQELAGVQSRHTRRTSGMQI